VYIKARESKSLAVNQAVALAFCCFFVSFTWASMRAIFKIEERK
jgi:hypothetical protein